MTGKLKTEQQETKHANPIGAAMFSTIRNLSNVFFTKSGKKTDDWQTIKMAAASVGFEDWLGEKLTSLNPEVDTEVFVTYITGILETETDEEDTRESIMDILGEVLVKQF